MHCGAMVSKEKLYELYVSFCHPGITRLAQFVKIRDLPYSIEKMMRICAGWKPRFHSSDSADLVKATQLMERLSFDFKGPLPSNTKNRYMLVVIDEYSRFCFVFACPNMTMDVVMKCLSQLFAMFGMPSYIYTDRGSSFISKEPREHFTKLGIATSRKTPYNLQGNGQCERYNGIVWKHVKLTLDSRNLPETQWETVLPEVLHSVRSLLCTATNTTPHERHFSYQRRSPNGQSIPSWFAVQVPILLQLMEANPQYAHLRFVDGRESAVSIRDLSPVRNMSLNRWDNWLQH